MRKNIELWVVFDYGDTWAVVGVFYDRTEAEQAKEAHEAGDEQARCYVERVPCERVAYHEPQAPTGLRGVGYPLK